MMIISFGCYSRLNSAHSFYSPVELHISHFKLDPNSSLNSKQLL